jgi:hypothetical protein
MTTRSASLSVPTDLTGSGAVVTRRRLARQGIRDKQITAQVAARRWQILGTAVVLHNGPLTRRQQWQVARVNCGPRAVLTGFTAAEAQGLRGWRRDAIHILAPGGTTKPSVEGIDLRLHRKRDWDEGELRRDRQLHRLPQALVVATSTFPGARPACGLLAAAVQQRLVMPTSLDTALTGATRTRHRAVLLAAVADIGQGAQALSEIDFVRLCRRFGMPRPDQQAVRVEPSGRRRYLDASWRRSDGRLVVVEVDGALHLAPKRWWDDQLRQNELVLADALVLRYPSVVIRTEELLVAEQLRRALLS